jgi:hypothetical protein
MISTTTREGFLNFLLEKKIVQVFLLPVELVIEKIKLAGDRSLPAL